MELQKDNVKIELVDIGEGWYGEYDPYDPQDKELLRFYVMHKVGEIWEDVNGASYCTTLPVSLSDSCQRAFLEMLMYRFYLPVTSGGRVKRIGEEMSWTKIEDIQHFIAYLAT